MTETTHVSIVVPLYNEEENVTPLLERIHKALENQGLAWELICVDDGSADDTVKNLFTEAEKYGNHVRIVSLQRNFGQTAAMQAGIDHANGDIIVTMDGDLQNDPIDIPRMVKRLIDEDLDLLVGWRKDRKDNWLRKIPSRIANRLIGSITQVRISDYGCSLKVYRTDIIKNVQLFGEMHRFIPAWVALQTSPARIKEEVVTHHPRQFGESKYGISRTFRVLLDLLSVYFFMRFLTKPAHFFGKLGLIFGALGAASLAYLGFIKFFLGEDIGQRPLILIGVLLVVVAIQLFTTGLLGEITSRIYFASGDKKSYLVRQRSSTSDEDASWKQS